MATIVETAEEQGERRRRVWSKRFSVLWSLVFCLAAATVVLTQVASVVRRLPLPSWLIDLPLPLFVIFAAVVLFALSSKEWTTVWDVIAITLIASGAAAPSVLTVLSPSFDLPIWFFLMALVFWLLVGLFSVADKSHTAWFQVLLWLGAASTMATVMCEIGLFSPIRFAAGPLREAHALSVLVDLRISLSVLFAALCLITAAVRELSSPGPNITKLRARDIPRVSEHHDILAPLANPPIVIVNALVFALVSLFNVLIGFVLTVAIRIVGIGVQFGKVLWQLLFEANAALQLIKAVVSMVITFAIIIAAFELAPEIRAYLQSGVGDSFVHLPSILAICAVVLFGSSLLVLVFDGRNTMVSRILSGSSLVAVLLMFAGAIVYAVAVTHLTEVAGFTRVGPVSVVGSVLLAIGLGGVTLMNIAERRKGRGSEADVS